LCLPLAFTFAALGSGEDRAGGAFRYVERAFGKIPGFAVGWSAWVTSVISWAAVASGVPRYLGAFVPSVADGAPARLTAATIVCVLSLLNVVGVKPSARLADLLTLGKLVPLCVFVALGLFAIDRARFVPPAPHGVSALPAMALMTMFAYQGFEVVGIPAGEIENPRRSVPRAVLFAMIGSVVLYALVQVVFVGVGGGSTALPLPDAARSFLGSRGATLLGLGGLVSMLGFNAGTALCTPRYLSALAEERLVPRVFARSHPRFDTPAHAIAASGTVAFVLTLLLDFSELVDLAVIAVLAQYLASSAALIKLGSTRRLKVLGGVSAAISVAFGAGGEPRAAFVLASILALGALLPLYTSKLERG
jgi:amino acid transporter